MSGPRILVAGLGNIFLGDDAFGVEVARRLAGRPFPAGVQVTDFGIRGLDLVYALLDGYDAAILIDAAPRGEPPGTLYVIEPDGSRRLEPGGSVEPAEDLLVNGHGLDPVKVLRLASTMASRLPRVLVLGCEPAPLDPAEDLRMELSAPVHAAVEEALPLVDSLIARIVSGELAGISTEAPG